MSRRKKNRSAKKARKAKQKTKNQSPTLDEQMNSVASPTDIKSTHDVRDITGSDSISSRSVTSQDSSPSATETIHAHTKPHKTDKIELKNQLKSRSKRLYTWYMSLPIIKRILWGLIIIPILGVLLIINSFLVPFLPIIIPIIVSLFKLIFVATKFSAFAVYIGYKVVKTFLGFYYCISRTLSGAAAHKMRVNQMREGPSVTAEFPQLKVNASLLDLKLKASWKKLHFSSLDARIDHLVMFSYLRYFLLGQRHLYFTGWKKKEAFFTIWRAESRETIKGIFKVGLRPFFKDL